MKTQKIELATLASLLVLLLVGVVPVCAQPFYINNLWNNPGTGKWEVSSNWSAGTAPGINDDDQIFLGTTVIIDATTSGSFSNTMTVGYVAVAASTVTLELVNAGTNVPLHILQNLDVTDDAFMVVTNSALRVDGVTTAGYLPGVAGSFELDSGWAQFGSITLGDSGAGDLYLNGGRLTVLGTLTLGGSPGGGGSVQMYGGTLIHTNNAIILGSQGSGGFNVYGGSVQALGFNIGNVSGSAGSLYVGGGTVRVSSNILVGNNLVTNPCSVTISSNSFYGTIGTLSATNAAGTAYIDVANNGSVTLNGGILQLDNLILTNGGTFTNLSGIFEQVPVFKVDNGGSVVLAGSTNNFDSGIVLGNSAGGLGSLVVQSNTTVTINSNLTVISGSLISTSSLTLNGGSVFVTNGVTQVGPAGNGLMTISGGSHTFRQIKLGSTNGLGSGGLLFMGGHLRILGVGNGVGQGLVSNWIIWPNGDLDGSGTSLSIGLNASSTVILEVGNPDLAPPSGQLDSMYVGAGSGYIGTYTQSAPGSDIEVSNKMIVGDCGGNAIGQVTLNSGSLYVTNPTHTAVLVVRNGTFTVNPGATNVVDTLIITNSCAHLVNNGGLITHRQLVLDPNLDADGDGLSNGLEQSLGMDPLNPSFVCAPSGIVAWWPAGGNANDIIGANNGTLQSGATYAAGKVGQAFSLDGVSGYVLAPYNAAYDFGGAMSVEAWVKTTAGVNRYIVTKNEDSFYLAIGPDGTSANKLAFYLNGVSSGWLQGTTDLTDNQWHHVAATYDGAILAVYVDGQLQNALAGTGNINTGTSPVYIGNRPAVGNKFMGLIDEVSLYNRALSASEVQGIYATGSAGKCVPPAYITSEIQSGNNLSLTWLTQRGLMYRMQYTGNVGSGPWMDVPGDVMATGSTATKSDTLPANTPQRYYRIVMFR